MIWGIMDLIMVVFLVSIAIKLFNWAKVKVAKWLVIVILLMPSVAIAQEWVDVPHGEDYCPYGDAVITAKKDPTDSTLVDCILYDKKHECWDTWIQNAKGERLHQCWEVDLYDAWTMDGKLTVHPKTDEVVIRPTGKELNEQELQTVLASIFKEVK